MNLEADLRSGEHNGENQESLKTRNLREVHPERGHQRLQGAELSHRPRHQPQPDRQRQKPSREEKSLEPVYQEPDGGRRAGRNHKKTPGPTASVRTTIGKARQHTQGTWRSSRRSQEKMGTGKYRDKLGKSAVTSHKEPRQTERGRRETTTPLLNGRLPPKRKPLQWKPSLAINNDKRH